MIKNIASLVLLGVTAFLSFKHGWETLNAAKNPSSVEMMTAMGIKPAWLPAMGVLLLLIGVLLLIPRTFFLGNLLNALSIVTVMALALQSGNPKMALMEIPFLAMPLLLIWLKYPFLNR